MSCDCATKTVGEAVATFLNGTDFEFVVMAEQIVIRQRVLPAFRVAPEPFVLEPVPAVVNDVTDRALEPSAPVQAVGSIIGRVVAQQTGAPLAAVQIYVADLDLGVLSQANGRYLLQNVPAGTYTVTAERIGYRRESASVTLGDGATVVQDFSMTEQALALDAVIVTGTAGGTQRRALGNVVTQIDASSIENRAAVRFEETLGSTVPGVRLMAPAGSAGGASEIRIRGSSSLALSGDPLIYVDGIRINTRRAFDNRGSATSRLQDIDPSSIESIEIIKGPAAATLYGTEASNGVIQIITKKGVQGETTFEASAEVGINWQPHPSQNFGLHWYKDPDTGEILNQNIYEMMKQPDQLGEDMFQNGPIQRYHVSARGGTDLVRYYAGVSREDVQGFSRIDFTESWSTQASITVVPTDNLSFTVNAQRMTGSTRDDLRPPCPTGRAGAPARTLGARPSLRLPNLASLFRVSRRRLPEQGAASRRHHGASASADRLSASRTPLRIRLFSFRRSRNAIRSVSAISKPRSEREDSRSSTRASRSSWFNSRWVMVRATRLSLDGLSGSGVSNETVGAQCGAAQGSGPWGLPVRRRASPRGCWARAASGA